MSGSPSNLLDAARAYRKRGWMPVPIPAGQKGPRISSWQNLRLSEDELPQHFNCTGNIGLLLGEPSGGLVDVDLDCPEAIELADEFLPPTTAVTGRPSAPRSHRWYRADDVRTTRHHDPQDRSVVVELRSTGGQTLVGPSVHPSGEEYDRLDGEPARVDGGELVAAVAELVQAIIRSRYPEKRETGERVATSPPLVADDQLIQRAAAYLDAMPPAISGQGGHNQTYAAATVMVHGFGLDPTDAFRLLWDRYNPRCHPPWSEKELRHKVEDAATKPHARPHGWLRDQMPAENLGGVDLSQFMVGQPSTPTVTSPRPQPRSVRELTSEHPNLRPPIIHGLLREGETMNIIASPKTGKSWLVLDLAIAVATGRPWLGCYDTVPGHVLIIDNELHRETSAHRIPRVAEARGVPLQAIDDRVYIENIRGRLADIFSLDPYFDALEPGRFKLIVLDAFYRFMPVGGDENDNGTMANIYNRIDAFADRLGCSFVLIHHSTKGNQSSKSVTDVGAGAGSQSRATDTHLVLRPHEEDGVVVLDAAVRSWPPIDPICLRWDFPIWTPDAMLDPTALRGDRSKKRKDDKPAEPEWDVERFIESFITTEPTTQAELREGAANEPGLSWRRISDLLQIAETRGLIERVKLPGRGGPVGYILSGQEASS